MSYKEYLKSILEMIEKVRTMEITSQTQFIIFCGLLAFGLLNCILGYRLLRFWVMLFGFFIGALAGYLIARRLVIQQRLYYLGAMVGLGIILAIVAFLIYKAGIFLLAAGLGMTAGIYFFRPTTSAMFFLCILLGVVLGSLGVKFSREVIIIATSLMGGALAGLSLGKLGSLPEFPYGILISGGFALLGMIVQFTINKPAEIEDYDEDFDNKAVRSADSVDFRLPGGYDSSDDVYGDDVYDDEPDERFKKAEKGGFKRAPDL